MQKRAKFTRLEQWGARPPTPSVEPEKPTRSTTSDAAWSGSPTRAPTGRSDESGGPSVSPVATDTCHTAANHFSATGLWYGR